MRISVPLRILAVLLGLLAGCGHSTNSFYHIAVSLNPASAVLVESASQQFTATVQNSTQGVTWSVQEGAAGGSVTATGLYTAPAAAGTYHVLATSNENTGIATAAAIQVVGQATLDSFTATPAQVTSGGPAVLQGTFEGGTGSIAPGVGAVVSGQQVTVNPTATTTYTLTVTDASGATQTASATVTVPAPALIQSFLASNTALTAGGSVTLTPTFSGGTGVVSPAPGAVTSGTGYPLTPTQSTTYELTVTDPFGNQVTSSLRVTVNAALQITSFNANPATLFPGASTSLQPIFAGGSGVITPSVGTVTSGGTYPVSPANTTNYTLTVTDALGNQANATTQVLLRAHGSYAATGPIGTPRKHHTATLLQDGTVLLAGGIPVDDATPSITVLNEAERYNPVTGAFTPVGTMTQARTGHAATLLASGKALITGGNAAWSDTLDTTPLPATATAELWDPATGQFTTLAHPMSVARRNHTATLLGNGQVLICGGLSGAVLNYGDIQASAELFDPTALTFTPLSPAMTVARQMHQALALQAGTVLLVGGTDYSMSSGTATPYGIANADLFTLGATPGFAATATSLGTGRGHAGAVELAGGQVFVAGGLGPADTWLGTTELYTPGSRSFALSTPMVTAMADPVAALLPSGQVLVIGEGDTEVCTPLAGTVASVTGLGLPAQDGLTATSLATGKVLVVNLEGAKLFDPLNP